MRDLNRCSAPARVERRHGGWIARLGALLGAALLAACGGSGGGGNGGNDGGVIVPGPTACSVDSQKQFVLDVARDWYLFPELLPAQVNLASYSSAQALLDALTATARAQGKDRFFSYVTTQQADDSFLQEGEFIGFGFRLQLDGSRLFLMDVFESSPAAAAGMARGSEILAIDSGSGFIPIANILPADPTLAGALGPADAGVQRGFRFSEDGVTTEVTLTKRVVVIAPVPADGVAVLPLPVNSSVPVAYLALRSYISTAETPLVDAFDDFRAQGINDFIIDLRYNGGGLISIADLIGDLFGANRSTADVLSGLRFNAARSAQYNTTRRFQPRPESVLPVRIAFITTGATASASEMTINSMDPWAEVAIVGSDTFGKPVGQSAFDQPGCDTRLRLVTFRTVNALERGDYYNGLADELTFACAAGDDLSRATSDPQEASTAAALQWLGTGACPQLMAGAASGLMQKTAPGMALRYPVAAEPTPVQTWLPGAF